ncbi:MAG: nucleotide exchange factor GrpE [Candidatus Sumerlaeaceae bacterium]|nr:nucleotide exchange factor GrpE [Candidatus Sumerlaeaceae bacterium]
MRSLFPSVLEDEFVIDEKPVQTYLTREEGQEDLTELVGKIMIENDRLQDLTEELKRKSAQPVEVEKFMKTILPTLDSFDWVLNVARGAQKSEEVDNWLKSVESIYFRLLKMLENHGLYQLKTIGKKIDLNLHEVVEYRQSDEHPNDVVIGERQKGYVFRNKLLRDAKVVAAYNERR